MSSETKKDFSQLGLNPEIVSTVLEIGFEYPTPIQQYAIPYILAGRDLLGQAQTGTGKTAAFALPLLNNIDNNSKSKLPQVLVLAPTRELAIQVADQFEAFAKNMPNVDVVCIYGGQEYNSQIKALNKGVKIVVGTTGRVIDHIKKGTLKLENLKALVLDEADEMLKMGFIDDVRFILSHISDDCQRLLFSATIPDDIADIIKNYLRNPCKIKVKAKTKTANTVTQKFIVIKGFSKIDALDRLLEVEETDGVIVFVKTKTGTIEVADKLKYLGYRVSAINGDMQQSQREYILDQFRRFKSDILVATDVVARGIDLERISHVINYDMPNDTDTYVHRIGRTGRAGREGTSISLVEIKEISFLRTLETFTGSPMQEIFMPNAKDLSQSRIETFKHKISAVLDKNKSLDKYKEVIAHIRNELELDTDDLLAVLTLLAQGKKTLFPKDIQVKEDKYPSNKISSRNDSKNSNYKAKAYKKNSRDLITYKLDVGSINDVQPRNIVGAIANEGNIDSKDICNISIHKDYTLVDLPANLSPQVINRLKKVWVAGKKLNIKAN
ncbi:MAG: DEAD/DEAH box helicase [Francisella sp.]